MGNYTSKPPNTASHHDAYENIDNVVGYLDDQRVRYSTTSKRGQSFFVTILFFLIVTCCCFLFIPFFYFVTPNTIFYANSLFQIDGSTLAVANGFIGILVVVWLLWFLFFSAKRFEVKVDRLDVTSSKQWQGVSCSVQGAQARCRFTGHWTCHVDSVIG